MLKIIVWTSLSMSCLVAMAQERCAFVDYENHLKAQGKKQSERSFESWMERLQKIHRAEPGPSNQNALVNIPVVVHVIHNGEPVGTGVNISDEQINSQITALNADYQRVNFDASNTPAEFKSVASNLSVNFVLAKQDPSGQATSGIVRIKGAQTTWSPYSSDSEDEALKATSYWPAENYINIWVTDLKGSYGYAQFPVTDLQGLTANDLGSLYTNSRLTDGVVIDYQTFGSWHEIPTLNLKANYQYGRTLTHELGHFFGLRHVWGDVSFGCGDDYVADTPMQSTSFSGLCPTTQQMTCNASSMYSNYMNYTNDACMNIFTFGQVTRMTYVLNNSPRRKSLLQSSGLNTPTYFYTNDVALVKASPESSLICTTSISPVLTFQNKGTADLYTFTVTVYDHQNQQLLEQIISFEPIATGKTSSCTLSNFSIANTTTALRYVLSKPNYRDDANAADNSFTKSFSYKAASNLPYKLTEPTQADWRGTWQSQLLQNDATFLAPLYTNTATVYQEFSPAMSVANQSEASARFYYSYAYRQNTADTLRVKVSTDCGVTFPTILWEQSGKNLAVADASTAWTPTSSSDWKRADINLTSYLSSSAVQLMWEATGQNGNNVYLKNVQFFVEKNPPALAVTDGVLVYGNPPRLTFQLNETQAAQVMIYTSDGRQISSQTIDNALNQTLYFPDNRNFTGLFFVQVITDTTRQTFKIFVP